MFLYAITNRHLAGGQPVAQREGLVALARTWAENGVAVVQLREKDLPALELISLAQAMHQAIRQVRAQISPIQKSPAQINSRQIDSRPRLVLNAPPAVALAAGADGVHLPATLLATHPLDEIRSLFAADSNPSIGHLASQHHPGQAGDSTQVWISVGCHTLDEVEQARNQHADCILFAPVFEKKFGDRQLGASQPGQVQSLPGVGMAALADACRIAHPVPVVALGGVTADNAAACIAAGASGIAAIRLFHASPHAWSTLL
ncbi:MAG TPA: thiamine phosphate synthase [Acidobacteriaceae bacterium]|jgi:thiamine-phosphate pyrophosphorylase|nr:thiamine phosphate synthase [Acidobacteriaceae bacterium]